MKNIIFKNRKGFTLIELLAVIVILAVLMLMATPAVLNIMNNARQNSFKTEALSIIDAAKTAYAADMTTSTSNTTVCYKIGSGTTLANYIDKDLSKYKGYVLVTFRTTDTTTGATDATYSIYVTNGTYDILTSTNSSGTTVWPNSDNYDNWVVTSADGVSIPSKVSVTTNSDGDVTKVTTGSGTTCS